MFKVKSFWISSVMLVNDELLQRLTNGKANLNKPLVIHRSSETSVPLDYHSSPEEVAEWLRGKGFTEPWVTSHLQNTNLFTNWKCCQYSAIYLLICQHKWLPSFNTDSSEGNELDDEFLCQVHFLITDRYYSDAKRIRMESLSV